MIRAAIASTLTDILETPVVLEVPNNPEHGDFATNVAFGLAKILKKGPKQIAETLAVDLAQRFEGKISFQAINGFLNLRLSDAYLLECLEQAPKFPSAHEKILLEYVSANPTGPLHVGHGRWAILGHSIESLLRFVGTSIDSEFYINDAGNQVELFYESVNAVKKGLPIPEKGYHGSYIHDLALIEGDPLQRNLELQKQTLARLGITFTFWYSEKELHRKGLVSETIQTITAKGLTYESEGALWFKSQSLGDEKDRVLIKADGQHTYFAADMAYHWDKLRRGYDRLINIWGADHHGYVARVKAGVAALCGEAFLSDKKFKIVIGQLVSLKRGDEPVRMSKRTGEIITIDEVVDEIGVDATRFFLIQKGADTHVEFDLELAKKKSAENPVYYIQYAHARMCSVLEKMDGLVQTQNFASVQLGLEGAERALILHCIQAYDEIYGAAQALAPHRVANYAYELARQFHTFYEQCPIIKASEDIQAKRVYILIQAQKTLRLCLELLGISAPEKM